MRGAILSPTITRCAQSYNERRGLWLWWATSKRWSVRQNGRVESLTLRPGLDFSSGLGSSIELGSQHQCVHPVGVDRKGVTSRSVIGEAQRNVRTHSGMGTCHKRQIRVQWITLGQALRGKAFDSGLRGGFAPHQSLFVRQRWARGRSHANNPRFQPRSRRLFWLLPPTGSPPSQVRNRYRWPSGQPLGI